MIIENLGLFLTIFFGLISVIGIVITIIVTNRPKIKYYQIDPSKLFSDKIDVLDKVEIHYRSKKIEGKLLFLQVLINNEGNCDIDSSSIYEPLNIRYEKPYKLLDAYVEKKEEKLNLELILKNNSIIINWDLLKKKEYFIINVILNYESDDGIKYSNNNLRKTYTTLKYRIKNIDKICKESYTTLITNKDKITLIILLSFLFINLLSLAYNEIKLNENYRKQKMLYQEIIENGKNINKLNGFLIEVNGKYINILEKIFNGNINVEEIESDLADALKLMDNADNKSNYNETSGIELYTTTIEIQDIDANVIIIFLLSVLIFLFDLFIFVNFIKKVFIAKYIK